MVTTSTRQRSGSATDRNADMYARAMQWEIFSEEERPLFWSHMVSFTLAITFMLLVVFGPRPVVIPEPAVDYGPRMQVDMDGLVPASELATSRSEIGGRTGGRAGAGTAASAAISRGHESGIAAAFRRSGLNPGGMVGASGVLRGVETGASGGYSGLASVGSAGQGGRAALSYGDGPGSRGSGRAGIGEGSGAGGGGIGGVGGAGSVVRSAVSVSAPRVVAEEFSGPRRDVTQLGSIMRDRQAVLQSCYTQQGLTVNPKLAGTMDVAITLNSAGSVARVAATPRSMSGAGTSEVASCIEAKIRNWKFPASDAGSGTYSFPFSFTS